MRSRSLRVAVWGCVTLAANVWGFPLHAAEKPTQIRMSGKQPHVGEQAFVEFHARSGPVVFGHSFIVYGRLNADGKIIAVEVAGLYTNEENYLVGAIIPLPAAVGRAKDDLSAVSEIIYRRNLTAAEFFKLKVGVNRVRAIQHSWHLLFFNCNDFAGEMAELIGLRRPPSLMLPITYVSLLSALNGRQMASHIDRRQAE